MNDMYQVQRVIMAEEASNALDVERSALEQLNERLGLLFLTRSSPGLTMEWFAVPEIYVSSTEGRPWMPDRPVPNGAKAFWLILTYYPESGS
jgi:hypothetical protein